MCGLSSQVRSPGKRKLESKTSLLCVRVGATRYTRSGAWGKSPSGLRFSLCDSLKHLDLFYALNLGRLEIHFLLIKIKSSAENPGNCVRSFDCLPLGNLEPTMGKFSGQGKE